MRRTALFLFHAAAVISFLLAMALVFVFLGVDCSGDAPDEWQWASADGGKRRVMIAKEKIEWAKTIQVSPGKVTTWPQLASLGYRPVHWNGWVFEYSSGEYLDVTGNAGPTSVVKSLTIRTGPMFLLCVALVTARVTEWSRLLRRRTRPVGHCAVCGYDLRATPDRCPECGTPAAAAR